MTKEQAIEQLKHDRDLCNFDPFTGESEPISEDCRKSAEALDYAIKALEQQPSDCPLVEIEERKHGKWEHDKLFGDCAYVCSFCHTIWTSSEIQNMHYCPTCGAEMIKE